MYNPFSDLFALCTFWLNSGLQRWEGSICLPPLFSSSIVTTSQEVQLKLLVLSNNSQAGNKRRNTFNISRTSSSFGNLCASGGRGGIALMLSDAHVHALAQSI